VCAAIKAKLAGVANMGTVHDYERYTKEAARLLALYESSAQGGNRIYGWFVAERQVRERYLDIGRAIIDTVWDLVSYMTLDDGDASEKLLRAQVDKVRDAFRNDDSLGGAVDTLILDEGGGAPIRGVQLDAMDKVLFAGALCHRARCSLVTRNYVTYQ
jgi:hypothetical protein